jgi:hypothetical protein
LIGLEKIENIKLLCLCWRCRLNLSRVEGGRDPVVLDVERRGHRGVNGRIGNMAHGPDQVIGFAEVQMQVVVAATANRNRLHNTLCAVCA